MQGAEWRVDGEIWASASVLEPHSQKLEQFRVHGAWSRV